MKIEAKQELLHHRLNQLVSFECYVIVQGGSLKKSVDSAEKVGRLFPYCKMMSHGKICSFLFTPSIFILTIFELLYNYKEQ